MTPPRRPDKTGQPEVRREASADEASRGFQELVREGQELRRAFEARTAKMRVITPDDMKVRSR